MESLLFTLFNPTIAISRLEPWKSPFYPIAVLWLSFFYVMSAEVGGSRLQIALSSLCLSILAFTLLIAYCGAVHVYCASTGRAGDVSRLLYGMSIALFPTVALPIAWDIFGWAGQAGLLGLQALVLAACARTALASVTVTYSTTLFTAVKALLFPPVLLAAFTGSAVLVLGSI